MSNKICKELFDYCGKIMSIYIQLPFTSRSPDGQPLLSTRVLPGPAWGDPIFTHRDRSWVLTFLQHAAVGDLGNTRFIVFLSSAVCGGVVWCWFFIFLLKAWAPHHNWQLYWLACRLPWVIVFPQWKWKCFGNIIPMNEGVFLIKVIIWKLSLISV